MNNLKSLALQAGEAIMEIYHTDFEVNIKIYQSPLTQADKSANRIILNGLRKLYPSYAILSEEEKDDFKRLENDYCFIVDPLDGTKEFVNKNGEFTVNIALVHNGIPVMGVVYAPVLGKLYYAERGKGAFFEYLQANTPKSRPIKVSQKLRDLIWVGSRSHMTDAENRLIEKHSDKITAVSAIGSSLKGCMVAEGAADIYYRFGPTSEWDTAAMQCIVEEAGGIMRQMDGSIIYYNRKNTLNEKGFYIVNRAENIWV